MEAEEDEDFFRLETSSSMTEIAAPNTLVGFSEGGLPGALPSKELLWHV